ncbi:MAG: methyltransferase domain-containing protein [Patescibacteria group bacterium]
MAEKILTKTEKEDLIRTVPFWWHTIDFGDGVVSNGHISKEIHDLISSSFPKDLAGKTVLDIGTWDGYYAFECEKRGATVTAIDNNMHKQNSKGFEIAKTILDSKVQYYDLDFFDVPKKLNQQFDVVLFLGVIYHLKNPLLALETLYQITKDILIIETHYIKTQDDTPMARFYPGKELGNDETNWWGPNVSAIVSMTKAAGFGLVEVFDDYNSTPEGGRLILLARKNKLAKVESITDEIKSQIKQNEITSRKINDSIFNQKKYKLWDLINYEDKDLINCLYLTILKRWPDQAGFNFYSTSLKQRIMEPIEILGHIRYSSEGKKIGVKVAGLKIMYSLYLLRRLIIKFLPFLKPLMDWTTDVLRLSGRLNTIRQKIDNCNQKTNQGNQQTAKQEGGKGYLAKDFFLNLANTFRGPSAEIENRLKIYLPYLEKIKNEVNLNPNILDLGCGRGEWLKIIKQAGYNALGVDQNETMVNFCKEQGLTAVTSNLFDYLKTRRANQFNLVTAFHLIEHLSFSEQMKLLVEINRILTPRGLVIIETPNPENLSVANHYFYLDPSHKRPVPPLLLDFLLKEAGFVNQEVLRLHPDLGWTKNNTDLNNLVLGPRDYAIIAQKI